MIKSVSRGDTYNKFMNMLMLYVGIETDELESPPCSYVSLVCYACFNGSRSTLTDI